MVNCHEDFMGGGESRRKGRGRQEWGEEDAEEKEEGKDEEEEENIDLEKNDEDEPQKPEDKGDPEGPEAGWWTRERVCGAKQGPGEGAPKAWRLGTGPFAFAGGDLWPPCL